MTSSVEPVPVGDEFPVRLPGGRELLVTLLKPAFQLDDLLFEIGDVPLQLVDVGGGPLALRPHRLVAAGGWRLAE